MYVEAGDGVAARAVDGVAVCDAIAAVYAAAVDVVVNAAVAVAPAAVLLLLLLLLRFLFMLPLFVLIIADVGTVPAGAAAAPASDGASVVVAVWLERGSFSLGVPQWRGVKGALGMQWPNLGSVTMGQNIGNSSGTPASSVWGIASTASRVLLE